MSSRLPTALMVGALRRMVEEAGGSAMVLARGDEQAGSVLVISVSPEQPDRLLERGFGIDGSAALVDSTPADGEVTVYWRRRRERDPDLWVIELNVARAERFVAETILAG